MSFFDSIKKMGKDASAKVTSEVAKFKSKDFLNAVVAGCALVAAADGSISSAEKQKMLGFINSSDELKVFGADEVIAAFNNVVSKFDFDHEIGKAEALKVISKIKSDVAASKLMIRVCCIIGASDGDFDAAEKSIVVLICRELGIDPAEFDLK
jgi:tellurite resistance protein TerB